MDISEIIRMITGGTPPNEAVINAQGALPPGGAASGAPSGPPPSAAPSAPPPTAPQGVRTPVTNPAPAASSPNITQSPPDLANMYVKLMEKNQNAARLDSGMSLIAAGLSNSPTNRAALISASGHGGQGGMSLSANDFINFNKREEENRNSIIRKNALPALMKQYGWSPADAAALEAGGKMDEVLQSYLTKDLTQVKDENGVTHMVNGRTGKVIATVGTEKPEKTSWQSGPGGPELRSDVTGAQIGGPIGLPPDKTVQQQPDGSWIVVDKNAAAGTVSGAREKIGDKILPVENELAAINAARETRGEKPLTAEELIKLKQHPGVTVNTGNKENYPHPKPKEGYDYKRNPDGTIKYDANGQPELYTITGGGPARENKLEDEKLTKEAAEKAQKEAKKKSQEAFAVSNVGTAVDKAFEMADKFGASGFGSKVVRGVPIGGMSWDTLDSALNTINANTAFAQLTKMREAAASGASGLGQVTEKENQMLSSVIADLRAYQDTDQLKKGLARVKASMELLAHNDYKTQADFDIALAKRSTEILTDQHNKSGRSKYKVTPVE